MIKNIVFDFGQVLVSYDIPSRVDTWGMTPEERKEFDSILMTYECTLKFDRGLKTFVEYMQEYKAAYPHLGKYIQMFQDQVDDFVLGQVPGMEELIKRLKANGYPVYGLTNWSDSIYSTLPKYPIFKLMDGTLISSEEKLVKPERAIFERLYEKFNLNPAECVFVDDNPKNIVGSQAAGMDAILFQDALQCEEELKARGVRV